MGPVVSLKPKNLQADYVIQVHEICIIICTCVWLLFKFISQFTYDPNNALQIMQEEATQDQPFLCFESAFSRVLFRSSSATHSEDVSLG